MSYELLQVVVLNRDLPNHELREGALGAVVEIYPPDGIEVEFDTASRLNGALATLRESDIRPVRDADLISTQSFKPSA